MYIDQETLRRVNIYAPYKGRSKLDTPEIRAELGVVEIADPVRGDENYNYNQEINEPPYLTVTPKSPEQIAAYEAGVAIRAADTSAHEDAKLNAVIQFFVAHTPAECRAKVATDVTNLATAVTMLQHFATALCVLAKKEFR
jgi:hypothetical protein